MRRYVKTLVWGLAFILSGCSAIAVADNDVQSNQVAWDGSAQLVERADAKNAAADDPVLQAITQAKREVKRNSVSYSEISSGASDSQKQVLKPNYTVVNVPVQKSIVRTKYRIPKQRIRTYGPIRRSDHLWQIARRVRPDRRCSIAQTSLAIFATNPQAFNYNNINGLRYGAILKVPSKQRILHVSSAMATQIIKEQNRSWQRIFGGSSDVDRGINTAEKNLRFSPVVAAKVHMVEEKIARRSRIRSKSVRRYVQPRSRSVEKSFVGSDNSLDTRVMNLEDDFQAFRQQVDTRFKTDAVRDAALGDQIKLLEDRLHGMQSNLFKLEKKQQKLQELSLSKIIVAMNRFNSAMIQQFGKVVYVSGVVLILLILLGALIWLIMPKKRLDSESLYHVDESYTPTPAATEYKVENQDAENTKLQPIVAPNIAQDEYDFMSGPEGLTTKVDLARVYIDMGDKQRARDLLQEVIDDGDEEQKQAANDLLATI